MNLIAELESEAGYADMMANAAHMWMKRARDAELKLAVAVYAAGGEVRVYPEHLVAARELELVSLEYPEDMSCRLRARIKGDG